MNVVEISAEMMTNLPNPLYSLKEQHERSNINTGDRIKAERAPHAVALPKISWGNRADADSSQMQMTRW